MLPPDLFAPLAPMPPDDAPDPSLRALFDALDSGAREGHAADEAAQALGAHLDPAVTPRLRAYLQRATCDVGATQLNEALRATLSLAETTEAMSRLQWLYVPLAARAALVRRAALALHLRADPDAWAELAAIATTHPSYALRTAVAGVLLGERSQGEAVRAPHAPVPYLEGLSMGRTLVESDGWSLELRRQAAEAMMVCDPHGAFDRLAPSLGYGTEAVPDEYTVRGIAAAWWARMRPEDDPRFAFAFGARMADPGSAPVVLFNILRGRGHPAAVDGALAALERTASRGALQVPYLYALLAALGDRRAVGPLVAALGACGAAPLPKTALDTLKQLDDPSALPALESLDAARGGDKALRSLIKHLARNAPKAKPAKKAKAPEPVAPGLPVWFAPPPLPDPATGDTALDALLAAMPHPDAAKSLAARRDGRAAEAVRARFALAADGVCDYTWDESAVAALPAPLKTRARRAHTALYGPINERLALLRALAADLARRHNPAGDAALAAVAEGHRWVHVRAVVVAAAVAAEPSDALGERLAAGFEAATDHDLALAMAEAVLALGDAVALVRFGAVLGTSRRLLAEAAMTALARHLTRRADRAWTALVVADMRAARHPFVHFHALGALADPAAVEAIGDAMTPLLKHGAGLAEAVQALRQMGDPRGAEYVLRVLERVPPMGRFDGVVEALHKLGDARYAPRVVALQAALRAGTKAHPEFPPTLLQPLLDAWGAKGG